jgi:membrane-bound lytic murein transglycosylase D
MWQFIASTGLRYGLARDPWTDERLDPEKSTDAAIAYLTELHSLFGDWPKALAAYNCGEGRVQRLQRNAAGEYLDFWDVYAQLPLETRRYVPRFVAAVVIIENPGKYGLTLPEPLATPQNVTTVTVGRSVELARLDEALGLAKETLRDLNPELRLGVTPKRPYDLRVPAELAAQIGARIAAVPEWTRPVPRYVEHRVRSGETLSTIARRYGTTVAALLQENGLRRATKLRIGQKLRVPARPAAR